MLMLILGAGATYDSAPDVPASQKAPLTDRPPLADELFLNRQEYRNARDQFTQFHALLPELLHRSPGDPVEKVLQRFQAEADGYPHRHVQLMALRFYLQSLITQVVDNWRRRMGSVTNHIALLDQIRRLYRASEPLCIVTFNYDTLIELALGAKFDHLSDYIRHPGFRLFKLHGSVNWGRHVTSPSIARANRDSPIVPAEIIASAAVLQVGSTIVPTRDIRPIDEHGDCLVPAIAIPIEAKSEFECPPDHLDMLRTLIPRTRKILTIGWRATEQHFLKLLSEHLKAPVEVLACSGSDVYAATTIGNIRAACDWPQFSALPAGFTELVAGRQIDDFLKK